MRAIAQIIKGISLINTVLGRALSWLTLGIVLVCFSIVVLRYAFSLSYTPLQDLYVWMNGIMFTGMAGYVFLRNGHVRVDIFYRPATLRTKAWIDLLGTIFLLGPFCFVVVNWGWSYVTRSWSIGESSLNVGGMQGLFVVKSFILVFAAVIALQGLALALRAVLVLNRQEDLLPPALRYSKGG